MMARRVSRLIDAAVTIDFTVGDEPGALALAAISAPSIAQVLRDAAALLQEVREYYESDQAKGSGEPADPDSLDGIGAMISAEVAAQEISDLAFLTRSQMRVCLSALEAAIDSQDPLKMVARADDAIRRLRRGLIPLENALGEFEGVAPPIRVWFDLEISLRIRSLYSALRRRVLADGHPTADQLRGRLEVVTRHLAELRSAEIYRFLRIDDRVQMRALYRRAVVWLNQPDDPDAAGGRHLWQDLTSFVELLRGVNNRQELREHDRLVLERACRIMADEARAPETVEGELLEELRNVVGRDDELDALVLGPGGEPAAAWLSPLRRVRDVLAGG